MKTSPIFDMMPGNFMKERPFRIPVPEHFADATEAGRFIEDAFGCPVEVAENYLIITVTDETVEEISAAVKRTLLITPEQVIAKAPIQQTPLDPGQNG